MQKPSTAWFDLPAVTFLAIATLIASARLVTTDWLPDLEVIATLTRLGLLLGVLLGYSRFRKFGISLLTFGYTFILVPWVVYTSITPYLTLEERLYEFATRFVAAFNLFFAREAVEDPILALTLLSVIFWIAALYAGFTLLRHQHGLAALLPSLLLILAVQYNDHKLETPLWLLGFYFFFAFVLLARLDYLAKREKWRAKNFFLIPDVKFDLNVFSIIAMGVLLVFTWNLPSSGAEWKEIARWWDKTLYKFDNTRRNLDNLFSAVDDPVELGGGVFYGTSLTLGERSYQGTNKIAIVDVSDPESIETFPPRYYWRVRSYDTYADGIWSTANVETTDSLPAQTPLLLPIDLESETAKFTFTNQAEQRINLLQPAQTYWVDIDTYATYRKLPDGALDLNMLRATKSLGVDKQYTVQAALLSPTVAELRAAGTDYPKWVTDRYLQLPEDLPAEISQLAHDLTRGRGSAYDKARVLTTYLRTEIEYSDTVPTPPADRDPLAWFLFTWQEGYCNYYASAQVVMLRSLGIPARLVVGFAQGKKVDQGNYLILQKDAHAWPEVYFPEIGWVEFEPTSSQTRLIRPLGEIEPEEEDGVLKSGLVEDEEALIDKSPMPTPPVPADDLGDLVEKGENARLTALFWGMIVLLAVGAFFEIWHISRKQVFLTRALRQVVRIYEKNERSIPKWISRWLAWQEARPTMRAFHAINRSLRWLHGEIPQDLTPAERAAMLADLLPEADEAIVQLLREHEKTMFTPDVGDVEIAQDASARITWVALKKKVQRNSEKTDA